jgi:hypothetical protein
VPPAPNETVADLSSVAFVFVLKIRFESKLPPTQPGLPEIGLPKLDHRLEATLTVSSTALSNPVTRTIVLRFTVPTITISLPLFPAVCICSKHAFLKPSQYLVMVTPGGPSSLSQLVATYNQVIDTISGLATIIEMTSIVLTPLQTLVDTLGLTPTPYLTNDQWVKHFTSYGDFDDTMSSFFVLARPAPRCSSPTWAIPVTGTTWSARTAARHTRLSICSTSSTTVRRTKYRAPSSRRVGFRRPREFRRSDQCGFNSTCG